jgi:hypothetical protein
LRYNFSTAEATIVDSKDYRILIPSFGETHASLIVLSKDTGSAVIFSRFSNRSGFEVLSPLDPTGMFILLEGSRNETRKIVLRNRLSAFNEVWTVNNPAEYGLIEQRMVRNQNDGRIEKSAPMQAVWKIDAAISGPWSAEMKEAKIVRNSGAEEFVIDGERRPANTNVLRAMGLIK